MLLATKLLVFHLGLLLFLNERERERGRDRGILDLCVGLKEVDVVVIKGVEMDYI